MQLTSEQTHAVDLFGASRSLKISAFAGTGKTSTLTALARSTSKQGLYLAFNKKTAEEAKAKFPQSVDCRTTHSLALRSLPDAFRGNSSKIMGSLQGNNIARLLDIHELAVGGITLTPRSLGYLTAKTVQRFCQSGDEEILVHHVPLSGKLELIASEYQDQFKLYLSQLAAHFWDRMTDPADDAPLGHDGYLKLWSLSRPELHYDFVLLDEAQDTNEAVLSVLRRQDCRLTLVGDRHQQIYEWRGATNAMESMDTDAEAVLTRSFRFGGTVAHAATSILKALGEPRPVLGNPDRNSVIASSGFTRAVLCRTNAGVVSVAVDALTQGRKPHVVGGVLELTRTLEDVSRLKRAQPAESAEFFGFEDWAEVVAFSESDEGEALRSFVGIVNTFGETSLIQSLKSVASEESTADVVISTGHKSKGREWDSVALHSDFEPRVSKTDPSKFVLNHAEARLLYVATTRAKELLVVPPRLAAKWSVPASEVPVAAPPQVAAPTQRPKNPRPALPAFVTTVPPRTVQNATPAPTSSEHAPPVAQEKSKILPTAAATSIIAAIAGFLLG